MSQVTKALPAGWMQILDDVQARLDHAVSLANARIDALPDVQPTSLCADRLLDITQWGERLNRLSNYLDSAEQIVQSVDEILHAEAERLKATQAAAETLRQTLAEGTGGAIG
jgi:hypothetical protein